MQQFGVWGRNDLQKLLHVDWHVWDIGWKHFWKRFCRGRSEQINPGQLLKLAFTYKQFLSSWQGKHLGFAARGKIGLLEVSTGYKYWNSSGQAVIHNLKKPVWGRCHFNFILTDLLNVNLFRRVFAKWNHGFVPLLHKISLAYSCILYKPWC